MGSDPTVRGSWRTCRSSRRSGCRWRCSPCTRIWTMGKRRWLALFACAWLVQALSNGYYLLFFPVLIALWLAWFVDWTRDYARGLALAATWVVASLPLVPVLLKYADVHRALGLARTPGEMTIFSAKPASFLHASGMLALWPSTPTDTTEVSLFPGVMSVALVIAGCAAGPRFGVGWRRPSLGRSPFRVLCRRRGDHVGVRVRARAQGSPGAWLRPYNAADLAARLQFAPRAGAGSRCSARSASRSRPGSAPLRVLPKRRALRIVVAAAGHRRAGRRRLDACRCRSPSRRAA